MPLYEYQCDRCGELFELLRPAARSDEAAGCPQCQQLGARRVPSAFATVTRGGNGNGRSAPSSSSCGSCAASSCVGCSR